VWPATRPVDTSPAAAERVRAELRAQGVRIVD
jgi:hypothetical protein